MLATVEGVYENGRVTLLEPLPFSTRARVVVTVLPDKQGGDSVMDGGRRQIDPMRHSGTVDWPVDGMEYQKAEREEWQ